PPPTHTLCPYTTLFRSRLSTGEPLLVGLAADQVVPALQGAPACGLVAVDGHLRLLAALLVVGEVLGEGAEVEARVQPPPRRARMVDRVGVRVLRRDARGAVRDRPVEVDGTGRVGHRLAVDEGHHATSSRVRAGM